MTRTSLIAIAIYAGVFLASAIGVGLFRQWSLRRNLLDVPNERSSHTIPTPRGGGAVIVLMCLAGYLAGTILLSSPVSWGFVSGAVIISMLGWFDDLYSLPILAKFGAHIAVATILVADAGYWSAVHVPLVELDLPLGKVLGMLVTGGWIVWIVNAYNFMDGIDGIAGLQAVVVGACWAVLGFAFGLSGLAILGGSVAAASAGFLVHNWHPAKIFMGDVGSSFLGFSIAAIPLMARGEAGQDVHSLPVVAGFLVWFFIFDTVSTRFYRAVRGTRFWEPHREHLYQRMVVRGMRHSTVASIYGAASAIVGGLVVSAAVFSGIFASLALLSLVVLTGLISYLALRKKD